MKRCLSFVFALSLIISCVPDVPVESGQPETISILSDETVFIGNGATVFVDVSLTPSGYDLTDGKTSIAIEVVQSNVSWFQGSAPIFYSFAGVEKTDIPEKYRIGIRDLGKGEKYIDKVRFVLKTITDEGTKKICSEEFTLELSGNSISSLAFLKKDNATALITDFNLNPETSYITLSSPYITSPNLALSFKTDAAKVLVGDVEQISGKTIDRKSVV